MADVQIPVKVTVLTAIFSEGERETVELTTFGRYYKKNNSSYLLYEEDGDIQTTVKISENDVLILRRGAAKMRLHFLLDRKTAGHFQTPYGMLETSVLTNGLDTNFNEETHEGHVDLLYDLAIQGSGGGTYHMKISYKEEGQ